MGQTVLPAPPLESPEGKSHASGPPPGKRSPRRLAFSLLACLAMTAALFYGVRAYRAFQNSRSSAAVPTVRVQRGDLSLTVTARGDLRGKNPEILAAPMTGGAELHLTSLARSGMSVKAGDTVAQFDTTEQEYKLKEAEQDLAEAEQHILQAKAQQQAQEEEDRYALLKAQTDVRVAELEVRKNPLLASIVARQNELALSSARDHLEQLKRNLTNRAATSSAAAAIQEAGRTKAETQATTARQNIEVMTLKAHRSGYVSVNRNSNVNFFFTGMTLPFFQVGDAVRPGMTVAEIPDLQNWEISANIGELDRGHLAVGDAVEVAIIAVPDQSFTGHVREIGGTSGPPWDRRFTCTLSLDRASPELRPGMSARLIITTDRLRKVLSLPAQAVFESDGRTFVYTRAGTSFIPKDVKIVRRNETRVVISGLAEGQAVALADPLEAAKKKGAGTSALSSLPK